MCWLEFTYRYTTLNEKLLLIKLDRNFLTLQVHYKNKYYKLNLILLIILLTINTTNDVKVFDKFIWPLSPVPMLKTQ